MIFDTDVVIWALRGKLSAADLIAEQPAIRISAVSHMELMYGMRNRSELDQYKRTLVQWQCQILQISQSISANATYLVERFCLSHDMQLADALIAATALEYGEVLASGNQKHFQPVENLNIQAFRPD